MDLGKAGGEVRKEKQVRREEKGGEQEARVKSKSQHERAHGPQWSVEARLPASLFVRVRRRTRFPRTSGLADIHPVRVYLGPRVIYAMAQIKYFNREGRGRAIPKYHKIVLRCSPT